MSGVTEVWLEYRLLQTVLFLTDSVFNALFACFLVSMPYIAPYIVEMIGYSRHCVRTIMNLVFDSTKVEWFALYHTNMSHEVPLSFV